MMNPYKAKYNVVDQNIAIFGYLSVDVLMQLSIKLIMYSKRIITYLNHIK